MREGTAKTDYPCGVMVIEPDEEDADSIDKEEGSNLSVELFGFLLEDS